MKRAIGLALGVLLLAGVVRAEDDKKPAGDLSDPVEILKRMNDATKAVTTVAYDVEFDGTGDAGKFVATGKGSVILMGWTGQSAEKYRVDVEATKPGADKPRRVSAGADGENFYLIDHDEKKAYQDIDPAVVGSAGQLVFGSLVLEFVHPTPFDDEVNGKAHELKGTESVAGTDCYVVAVEYANGQKATWCIGKEDFLPRRRIDHFDRPGMGKGDVRKTITKLVVDPKLNDDSFKLNLPEGFTKVDDFAP